ncbi:hypothetical protein [Candidatus Electrothrix sp.]|uniref:hypothetical protein n=1 Tax=Candidatus Electrothrix sp. TaxID=2170559 RepID=UPI004055D1CE
MPAWSDSPCWVGEFLHATLESLFMLGWKVSPCWDEKFLHAGMESFSMLGWSDSPCQHGLEAALLMP